jgi:dTDP-4-amino-4,6-dideoxygalactose transaminase
MPAPPPIPFNKPFIAGKELFYIAQAVTLGNIGGDGHFTKACARLMEERFGVGRALLTPSCTAALEMAAMIFDLREGDEVIMPSFTFVSTANAVVLRGARPVFVDIRPDTLNLDESLIERAITPRTRAIFPVHYAGVACEMDAIMAIADAHGLHVVEDAAQGVHARSGGRALGSVGHLGCYSFHETKNYICGEGGALCVNDQRLLDRAEIIRDKGTNRRQFFRGQVDKYTWVDIGSSYVPSEIVSAFLYGQLEMLDAIRDRRRENYAFYHGRLAALELDGLLRRPVVPRHCETNYHMYHILMPTRELRDGLLQHLNASGIGAVFHYVPLHSSPLGTKLGGDPSALPVTTESSGRLLRLPLFYEITPEEQERVCREIERFLHATCPATTVPVSRSPALPEPVAMGGAVNG